MKFRFVLFTLIVSAFLVACQPAKGLEGFAGNPNVEPTADPAIVSTEAPLPTEVPADPTTAPAPTPSGLILFVSDRTGSNQLYLMDVSSTNVTVLTNTDAPVDQPRWSPDGSRVAFSSTVDDNTDIYLINADGSNLTRLTDDPARDAAPTWSPDGQWVAFESLRDGNTEIYIVDVNGGNLKRLTFGPVGNLNPQWSPVGDRIAFVSTQQTGNSDIFIVNADGSGLFPLTNDTPASSDPVWSPDGTQIAYRTSFSNTSRQIWLVGGDGSNAHSVTGTGIFGIPTWSHTGWLGFIATRQSISGDATGLDFVSPLDGSVTQWSLSVEPRSEPSWSADGAFVVFQANTGGNMELFLLRVDTGEVTQLTYSAGYDGLPMWR